jgi:PAS domain S-box-containing protein
MATQTRDKPSGLSVIEGVLINGELDYRDIVQEQTELICRFNPQKKLIFVNDAFCSYFRKKRQDLIGESFLSFFHTQDRKKFEELLSSLDLKNPVAAAEHRIQLSNGDIRWLQWTHRAIFNDRGILEFQALGRDLTERIKAERALRESEERYRRLIAKMFNGFALFEIICDRDGKPWDCRFIEVNQSFGEITGVNTEEVVGRTLRDIFPETKQSWINACARVAFKGKPLQFKKSFNQIGKDLEVLAYSPIKGQFATVFTDVTERVKMEMTLRERENNFRALADNSNDGIRIASRKGEYVYVNKRYSEITGYSMAELKKMTISDLAAPSKVKVLLARHEKLIEGQLYPAHYRSTIVHKSGKEIPIDVTASKTIWQGHSAAMTTIKDISLRNDMERAIQTSVNNFRNLAENATDGIVIAGENGMIIYVNHQLSELTGYTVEELCRSSIEDICHPDEVQKISQRHRLRLDGKVVPHRYETLFLKKSGGSIPVELAESKTVWLDRPAVLRIVRDINLRKKLEEALGKVHNELEHRVDERTKELMVTAAKLESNQEELMHHKIDLEKANKELVQTNTALSVLARNIDKKRDDVEKKIARIVSAQIIPLVEELQSDKLPESSRAKLTVLKVYLNDLTPGAAKGHDIIVSLSGMELRVAVLIKNGFSSDDIARLLCISPHTVKTHRRNIRKKLNVKNSNINLASFLKLKMGKMSTRPLTFPQLSLVK